MSNPEAADPGRGVGYPELETDPTPLSPPYTAECFKPITGVTLLPPPAA